MIPALIVPPGWNQPTAQIVATVEQAAEQFEVPPEVLYGVIREESNFKPKLDGKKHGGNSETFRKSYEHYKDLVIPGKNPQQLTWGQMFPRPEDWRPRGLTQLMPYHVVGKTGGVPAGAPLKQLYDVVKVIRLAAAYLRSLYDRVGSWFDALRRYNGSRAYARRVSQYALDLKRLQEGVS